jgi:TonB family protein
MRFLAGRSFVVLALGLALGCVPGSPLRAQDTVPAPPTLPIPAPVRPTLGTILDTASLRAGLRAVAPLEDERRLARLIRVSWDTSGAPQRPVVMVHGWAPGTWSDTVTALVRGALRPIAASALRTTRYLLIETGPAARVEELQPEVTYARVANLGPLNRALNEAASDIVANDDGLVGRTLPVRLTMTITAEGSVEDLRVVLSSGREDVDAAAMKLVSATRFVPQRVDGEDTPSRVTLPLRFVFPE